MAEASGKITVDVGKSNKEADVTQMEESASWQKCVCNKATCCSCIAEWLATVDNDAHICSSYSVQGTIENLRKNGYKTAKAEASMRKLSSCCMKKLASMDYELEQVRVIRGPANHKHDLYIYYYPRAISDSTADGSTQFSYASAIVVLRFAYAMVKDPTDLPVVGPPEKLSQYILQAIREGKQAYEAHFKESSIELGPEETLQASRDLEINLVFNKTISANFVNILVGYLSDLQPGQILLIYRYKPYKALSIVASSDPELLCVFDSQQHVDVSDIEYGAMVFATYKKTVALMLYQLQLRLLPFQGRCSVLLLEA